MKKNKMRVINENKKKINLKVMLGGYSNVTFEDDGSGDLGINSHASMFDMRRMSHKEFLSKTLEAITAIQEYLENKTPVLIKQKKWWEVWK